MTSHRQFLCVLCVSAFSLFGCPSIGCATERTRVFPARSLVPTAAAPAAATQPTREFHLHLNGIGGYRAIDRGLISGLRDGGYGGEIKAYDWTGRDAGLAALTVRKRHREQAARVAKMLLEEWRTHPGTRITVTAHSAGAGIITCALEQLTPDVMIESLIMLAPALSPSYDLSRALHHVRGKVFVFSSPYDSAVLGMGTKMFGTVDGPKVEASGKVGFTRPASADVELYAKLVPAPYQTAWAALGNIGDHIGAMERPFAREVLAAVLLRGEVPAIEREAAPLTTPPPPATVPAAAARAATTAPATPAPLP